MQYAQNSDGQDLVSLLNDLTGMDNNVYPLVAKTRDMNTANRMIWGWIHDAYGGWQYDDANNTVSFPSALTTITSGQKDYGIPSEALSIRGVEVKDTGGVWTRLFPITEERVRQFQAEKEFEKTSSKPMYYYPYANSIKIFPASDYTQASSLRVTYDRASTSFVSTDTTKTPGFYSEFHDAVAYGAGFFFSRYKVLPQKNDLNLAWQDWEKRIKQYYSSRYQQLFPARMTVNDATREYM